MAQTWRSRARRLSVAGVVAAALLAPGGGAWASTAQHPSVTYGIEGRTNAVVARGVVTYQTGKQLRLNLQRRVSPSRWVTVATESVHLRAHRTAFTLDWKTPPKHHQLALRVTVSLKGHTLAVAKETHATAGDPASVYYSGEGAAGAGDVGDNQIRLVADARDLQTYDGVWDGKPACTTTNAVPKVSSIGGEPITELAGFSLGRLGPIYFLIDYPAWAGQINYILLLDPGPLTDMAPCEPRTYINPTTGLQFWLAQRPTNRLVIMAGTKTQDGGSYAGINQYYLSGIAPAQQSQVLICSISMGHPNFMVTAQGGFGWMVGSPPPQTCPGNSKPDGDKGWPVKPTQAPPTQAPPTQAKPTQAPPTQAPPTQAPPTQAPPTQAPPTQAPPTQAPPTQAPPTQSQPIGVHIEDDYYGGTWARNDPNDGTWHAHNDPPGNSPYWYPNGLGVAVDCERTAASYPVLINGQHQTWDTWFHVTDGEWYPSAATQEVNADGAYGGLPYC